MRHVVVTTAKRGVFFGELAEQDKDKATCTLKHARMCVYWSEATRGVLGLAASGPREGSKITPYVPNIELNEITALMDATPTAVEAWEKGLWG